jgi:hypothetical protein
VYRSPVVSLSSYITPVLQNLLLTFTLYSVTLTALPAVFSLSSWPSHVFSLSSRRFPVQYISLPSPVVSLSYCLQYTCIQNPSLVFNPVFNLSSCLTLVFRISSSLLPCIPVILLPLHLFSVSLPASSIVSLSSCLLQYTCIQNPSPAFNPVFSLSSCLTLVFRISSSLYPVFRSFYCLFHLFSVSLPASSVVSLSSCRTLVIRISVCLSSCILSLLLPCQLYSISLPAVSLFFVSLRCLILYTISLPFFTLYSTPYPTCILSCLLPAMIIASTSVCFSVFIS